MARLAIRKRTPSTIRRPIRVGVGARPVAKKKIEKVKMVSAQKPIYYTKIENYVKLLDHYVAARQKQFGPNDPVAKRLHNIRMTVSQELRKAHFLNQKLTQSLKKQNTAWRGVTNVPKSLKTNWTSLQRFLKDQINKEVINHINNTKNLVSSWCKEMKSLEASFTKQSKVATKQKCQLKIDPSTKKRFISMQNQANKYKSMWTKRLNSIALHGNKNIKNAINSLKKQMDEMMKCSKKCGTFFNKYSTAEKAKKGFQKKALFTAAQMQALETKYKQHHAACEKGRQQADLFKEWLKATKVF